MLCNMMRVKRQYKYVYTYRDIHTCVYIYIDVYTYMIQYKVAIYVYMYIYMWIDIEFLKTILLPHSLTPGSSTPLPSASSWPSRSPCCHWRAWPLGASQMFAWRLHVVLFWFCCGFLVRDYNILPNKELHWILQVVWGCHLWSLYIPLLQLVACCLYLHLSR